MRTLIYARKSTAQDGPVEARSVERQIDACRKWAKTNGHEVAHVFSDDGVSGYLFANRPGFQEAMRACEAGDIEGVLIWDLDRFGRNSRRTMESLHELDDLGVEVIDVATGRAVEMDEWGEVGTFVRAKAAEAGRQSIRKHTRAALRRQVEQGFAVGCPPLGYTHVGPRKQKKLVVEPKEAALVQRLFAAVASGTPISTLCRQLNQEGVKHPRAHRNGHGWSATTVKNILERPIYRGEVTWAKTKMVEGRELGKLRKAVDGRTRERANAATDESTWIQHKRPDLRIIDERTAKRVEAMMDKARRSHGGRPPTRSTALLSGGLLQCPTCGGPFQLQHGETKYAVYICARRKRQGTCDNRTRLPVKLTDESVLRALEDDVLSPRAVERVLASLETGPADDRKRLEAERDTARAERDRLVGSIAAGVPAGSVAPAIKEREDQIARLDARLAIAPPEAVDRAAMRKLLKGTVADYSVRLRENPEVARLVLRQLLPAPIVPPRQDNVEVPEYILKWKAGLVPPDGSGSCLVGLTTTVRQRPRNVSRRVAARASRRR